MLFCRRKILLSACFALLFLCLTTPVWPEDGRALLHSVAENYRNLDTASYYFEVVTESEFATELSKSWEISYATLARDQRRRHHFATKNNAMGWTVVLADGKTEWTFQPWKNEYTEDVLGPQPDTTRPLQPESPDFIKRNTVLDAQRTVKRLSKLEDSIQSAELLTPEIIYVNGQNVRCSVLRVTYKKQETIPIANFSRETVLWIDPQWKLIRKEHTIDRGQFTPTQPLAETTHDKIITYKVAQIGGEVPDGLFRFEPPAEARLVDRFSVDGVTANLLGQMAPPIKLKTLAGKPIGPDHFTGKILLVDFWATWCKPCLVQMPVISKLHRELKDKGVVVVGINKDENPRTATAYLQTNGYEWLNLHDEGFKVSQLWGTNVIPTLALVNREGKIVFWKLGASRTDETDIHEAIRRIDPTLLAATP